MKVNGKARFLSLRTHIKKNKRAFTVYLILRLSVILTMISAIFRGNFESLFVCLLTLILFLLPMKIEDNLGIHLPDTLQIIILCFIFAAEILGELQCFYVRFQGWDTMLHTANGFLCAAVGFSLVDIFNRNKRFQFELSPFFLALVAFCFSMTIGVLWEFFECGMDLIFRTDMQKDTLIHSISSVYLDVSGSNHSVIINGIAKTMVNDTDLGVSGYLDIGLLDTMKDLFVNFIGAIVFSVIGFFYVRSRGKNKFAKQFIPVVTSETPPDSDSPKD